MLVEWAGMVFWWPEEGSAHAARMLRIELGHLNRDFARSEVFVRPAALVGDVLDAAWHWGFEVTRIADALLWLGTRTGAAAFVEAALLTLQLFLARCVVLVFSLPAFAVFVVVGLATGLSMRDIRRWSAGREYGGLFHMARRWPRRVLLVGAFAYLSAPVAVHPTAVVLPSALVVAFACAVATATFKKYL